MPYANAPLNRVGIPIIEPARPSELFYLIYDGTAENWKGVKYRPAAFPSRLKHTE